MVYLLIGGLLFWLIDTSRLEREEEEEGVVELFVLVLIKALLVELEELEEGTFERCWAIAWGIAAEGI